VLWVTPQSDPRDERLTSCPALPAQRRTNDWNAWISDTLRTWEPPVLIVNRIYIQHGSHRQADDVQGPVFPAHPVACRRRSRAQSSCCTEA
jgi:hypothetical protein